MRRTLLIAILSVCASSAVVAQTQSMGAPAETRKATAMQKNGSALEIPSGTRLTAQLQSSVDLSKAKVGDSIVLETTEDVKANGRIVVAKGSQLVGHLMKVEQKAEGAAGASVGLVFDQLKSGAQVATISTTIESVMPAGEGAQMNNHTGAGATATQGNASSSTNQGASSSGGGSTGSTEMTGGMAQGAGAHGSTSAEGGSANPPAEGGSMYLLSGDNLRLEKGTTFHLTVNEPTKVGQK